MSPGEKPAEAKLAALTMDEILGPVAINGALTLNETGMITGVLPAPMELTVMAPIYEPGLIPVELTVTTSVDGVVDEPTETLSQLGDADTENGSAVPPETLMDWLAGLAAPVWAVKDKLVGLAASFGLLETSKAIGRMSGEFVALGLVIAIVAV
jgi:hypothetical protein